MESQLQTGSGGLRNKTCRRLEKKKNRPTGSPPGPRRDGKKKAKEDAEKKKKKANSQNLRGGDTQASKGKPPSRHKTRVDFSRDARCKTEKRRRPPNHIREGGTLAAAKGPSTKKHENGKENGRIRNPEKKKQAPTGKGSLSYIL